MTRAETLEALAKRYEIAEGPDDGLDAATHAALGFCLHPKTERSGAQSDTGFTCMTCGADSWGNKGPKGERLHGDVPAYTASLDAAIPLAQKYLIITMGDIVADGLPGVCLLAESSTSPPLETWGVSAAGKDPIGRLARAMTAASLRAEALRGEKA